MNTRKLVGKIILVISVLMIIIGIILACVGKAKNDESTQIESTQIESTQIESTQIESTQIENQQGDDLIKAGISLILIGFVSNLIGNMLVINLRYPGEMCIDKGFKKGTVGYKLCLQNEQNRVIGKSW